MGIIERVKNVWNAFSNRDPTNGDHENSTYFRPDGYNPRYTYKRSIAAPVLNRIALDVSAIEVKHVTIDDKKRFVGVRDSTLNECLQVSPNIDQTPRAFFQDYCLTLFEEGHAAIIPAMVEGDPIHSDSYEILAVRVGRVIKWMPEHVTVDAYDQRTGKHSEITLPKRIVLIVQNPFRSVMNEPNSILQKIIRKLDLLDIIDEQTSSGKLDLIIQLPYVIKTEARREEANKRIKEIERQLSGSKYGVAYTDGTERITQLNRSVENNLMKQVEYLIEMFYSQMTITKEIMNGTADENTMLNYLNRTCEPVIGELVAEMNRKWLSKTARSQGQAIKYFQDNFKLVPLSSMAELGDKFIRNRILTSNEFRAKIGFEPSNDPGADKLENPNIAQSKQSISPESPVEDLDTTNEE